MKTAEEWHKLWLEQPGFMEIIRAAQLDAWKKGMTDAAQLLAKDGHRSAPTKIIKARDNKNSYENC